MYQGIGSLMNWRAGLVLTGRFEDLARAHLYPMPLYTHGQLQAYASPLQLEQAYRHLQEQILDAGATAFSARVTAVELPRGGRFRVWVDWVAHLAGGTSRTMASSIEFMRDTHAGLRTEMAQWDCLMPQSQAAAAR